MVRRLRTREAPVDLPDWVYEYRPSPAHPTPHAWFLAVREYTHRVQLREQSVTLWCQVMSSAYAQRSNHWDDHRPAVLAD